MKSYLDWLLNTEVASYYNVDSVDNKWLRRTPAPRLYCKDGENVSIQAGEYLYCHPRTNRAGWTEVECGFPSCVPPVEWKEYAEEWEVSFKDRISRAKYDIFWGRSGGWKYSESNRLLAALSGMWRGIRRTAHRLFTPQPCNTIYPWIPVEVVKLFIAAHGGEDTDRSFAGLKED